MKNEILRRLEEIEKRASKATPGPWRYGESRDEQWVESSLPPNVPHHLIVYDEYIGEPDQEVWKQTANDLSFIAHAREDVPWLCSLMRKLLAIAEAACPFADERRWEDGIYFGTWEEVVRLRAALDKLKEDNS